MTESELRTNSNLYNEATRMKQLVHEEYNSAYNHRIIIDAIADDRARDINEEPKVERDPCIIIGSGPSLDDAMPRMSEWTGGIICTTSHARTLMYHGVEPTHLLVLDPFCTWEEIADVDWGDTRTKLITHPGAWPSLLEKWPNEMLLYRESLGRPDHFYQTVQKRMYTNRITKETIRDAEFHYLIPSEVTLFACSPPAQAFVANVLGYGTLFMVGVDFAYHHGKERFTEWIPEDGIWTEHVSPYQMDGETAEKLMKTESGNQLVQTDNGLWTHQVHLYYKKNMLSALRLSWQNAVWVGDGAVTEYPTATVKQMYDKQGKGFKRLSHKAIRDITDAYLAKVGAYVIEADPKRMAFIETNDPEKDLYNAMIAMKRKYQCTNCGAQGQAKDDAIHDNEPCKVCGKPDGMQQTSPTLDIDANMRRFRRIIKHHGENLHPTHPSMLDSAVDGGVVSQ